MSERSSLGDRMKRYEASTRFLLNPRTPLLVRVDGKAFHTYTVGMERPFDQTLIDTMVESAEAVAMQMQGFKVAYTQSDEASFLLTDWDSFAACQWFDGTVQKIASVAASIMTAHFNRIIGHKLLSRELATVPIAEQRKLERQAAKIAYFDARAYSIPKEDVANYFVWRAKDWERNSLQMLSRAHYSQKELHGQKRADMHELLHKKGVNWASDISDQHRNGTYLIRNMSEEGISVMRRTDILPNHASIAAVVDPFMRVPEVPCQEQKPTTPTQTLAKTGAAEAASS